MKMSARARTRLAVVLLVCAVAVVLPGALLPYYLPKLVVASVAIVAAACAPPTGRLPRAMVIVFAAAAGVLLIAALSSSTPLVALLGRAPRYEGVLALTCYLGLVWAGARLLGPGAEPATTTLLHRGVAVVGLAVVTVQLAEALGARPIGGTITERTGSLTGNASDAGLLGVLITGVLCAALVRERHPLLVLGALAGIGTVALSASRGALAGAAVGLVVGGVALAARRTTRSRGVLIGAAAVAIVGVVSAVANPATVGRVLGVAQAASSTVDIRVRTWAETLKLIGDHPAFGVGPNGFSRAVLGYHDAGWATSIGFDQPIDSPHDVALQAAASGGIPLVLLLVALVVVVLTRVVQRVRASGTASAMEQVVLAAALLGVGVGLLVHFTTISVLALGAPTLGALVALPRTDDALGRPDRARGRARATRIAWVVAAALCAVTLGGAALAQSAARVASDALTRGDAATARSAGDTVAALAAWDGGTRELLAQYAAQAADSAEDATFRAEAGRLAAEWGNRASALLGGSPDALRAEAVGLAINGDDAGAAEALDRAIAWSPGDPDLYVRRSVSLADLGRIDDAIADCERALTLDPGNTTAASNLAILRGL
ncbi:O-antigen ligase family protein [Galbitalea sp. SE-J8]|uniref:O-antigen ligase family protein n=1 Tax=Galbitalea sp. SE-J8 TaxID=3054952 RepID=UPI00259D2044|nr:O-antigen ligase family protein [Galbitalea sp. SE-J8]MDM4764179.1 O-antigen ligase family protein [Galbitalea sp. SE-J8]